MSTKKKTKIPYKKDEINSMLSQIQHSFDERDEADFVARGEEIKKILKKEIKKEEWFGIEGEEPYPKQANLDTVAKYRLQQIRLVGSIKMYEKVVDCFQECVYELAHCSGEEFHKCSYDPLLTVQYFDLYQWREDFFNKHFPVGTWVLGDDCLEDVIPYNLMGCNFDRLVAIACCNREATSDGDYVDICAAPEESPWIEMMFSRQRFKKMIEVEKVVYANLNNDHVLHMLASTYPKEPFSLQFYANKVYWANDYPLKLLSKPVQKEAKRLGSPKFINKKNITDFLSTEGKEIFMKGVAKFYYRMWRKADD